jgi:hypothetical protein
VKEEMVGAYVALLKDNEAEVRSASAGQLPGNYVSDSIIFVFKFVCFRFLQIN